MDRQGTFSWQDLSKNFRGTQQDAGITPLIKITTAPQPGAKQALPTNGPAPPTRAAQLQVDSAAYGRGEEGPLFWACTINLSVSSKHHLANVFCP